MTTPITYSYLYRRLSRALQIGRGIKLSAEELDLLMVSGALEQLSEATTQWLREQAQERVAGRQASIAEPDQPPPDDRTAAGEAAAERVRELLGTSKRKK